MKKYLSMVAATAFVLSTSAAFAAPSDAPRPDMQGAEQHAPMHKDGEMKKDGTMHKNGEVKNDGMMHKDGQKPKNGQKPKGEPKHKEGQIYQKGESKKPVGEKDQNRGMKDNMQRPEPNGEHPSMPERPAKS